MPFDLKYPAHDFRSPRPGYRGTSLQYAFSRFPDEDACLWHMMTVLYGDPPLCPKCGKTGSWRKRPGRKNFGHSCGADTAPRARTIFDRSHVPLDVWFYALLHFANSAEGVNPAFLSNHLGVSEPTAYQIAERTRLHMAAIDQRARIGTEGRPVFVRLENTRRIRTAKRRQKKAKILLLADAQSVQTTVMSRWNRRRIYWVIKDKVRKGCPLVTTDYYTSKRLPVGWRGRQLCRFEPAFFFENPETIDRISGFLAYFRWPMKTQYRWVHKHNLWKYLKEAEFRYNRRSRSHETYWDLLNEFPTLSKERVDQLEAWNWR